MSSYPKKCPTPYSQTTKSMLEKKRLNGCKTIIENMKQFLVDKRFASVSQLRTQEDVLFNVVSILTSVDLCPLFPMLDLSHLPKKEQLSTKEQQRRNKQSAAYSELKSFIITKLGILKPGTSLEKLSTLEIIWEYLKETQGMVKASSTTRESTSPVTFPLDLFPILSSFSPFSLSLPSAPVPVLVPNFPSPPLVTTSPPLPQLPIINDISKTGPAPFLPLMLSTFPLMPSFEHYQTLIQLLVSGTNNGQNIPTSTNLQEAEENKENGSDYIDVVSSDVKYVKEEIINTDEEIDIVG